MDHDTDGAELAPLAQFFELLSQLLNGLSEFSNLSLQSWYPISSLIRSVRRWGTVFAQLALEPLRYFREALGRLMKTGRVKVFQRDPQVVQSPFRFFG